jgi:DNA-binding CsgD family transcriptional regulator
MLLRRETERVALGWLPATVREGPCAVVLAGEQGIGKSTLWDEGVDLCRTQGVTVLSCQPTGSDTDLSFVGLHDLLASAGLTQLLGGVADAVLGDLPEPQRTALEVAIHRRTAANPPAGSAVSLAVLGVLRALAERTPVVVAVDDVQWLDPSSARALAFVARRVGDARLGFLLAIPDGELESPLDLADRLPAGRLREIRVGPLDPDSIVTLIRTETGRSSSPLEAARIAEVSGGNPFYALEIARAAARGDRGVTGQSIPIPKSLRDDVVRDRVARVPRTTRDALLVVASAARPTTHLVRDVLAVDSVNDVLQPAIDAGILDVTGLDVRFAHPLYRSATYADASRAKRHETHARLATICTDEEECARHLALAADAPDGDVAKRLEAAAVAARSRGAPEAAAELLEHAVRLTPADAPDDVRRRLLLASADLFTAGETETARASADEALRMSTRPEDRAAALRAIAEIELERGAGAEARSALERALAETSRPSSTAAIHRDLARVALRTGDVATADRHVRSAIDLARDAADETLGAEAEVLGAHVSLFAGRRPDEPLRADPSDLDALTLEARALTFGNALDRAETVAVDALAVAAARGDEPARREVLGLLAQIHVRAAAWDTAREVADQALDLAAQLRVSGAFELGVLAYAAAGRGDVEAARAAAAEGLRRAGEDRMATLWCLGGSGFLEVSLGQAADAVRHLGRAGGLLAQMGIADPGAFPFVGDEPEALIGAGAPEAAERRIGWLEERAGELDRPSIAATAGRCRGILLAAAGEVAAGIDLVERAVAVHEGSGPPLEHARSLLALGAARRRDRQKRPAREALDAALGIFERTGSAVWAARARDELARIGGRRASTGELTETEERVARLAAAGLTNREIATTLFLSVRTVEGHLSHVYTKLELRSRTELAVFFQPE